MKKFFEFLYYRLQLLEKDSGLFPSPGGHWFLGVLGINISTLIILTAKIINYEPPSNLLLLMAGFVISGIITVWFMIKERKIKEQQQKENANKYGKHFLLIYFLTSFLTFAFAMIIFFR